MAPIMHIRSEPFYHIIFEEWYWAPAHFYMEKNGSVTATKLETTNIFFLLLQRKILLQQPNVLLIELNILLL